MNPFKSLVEEIASSAARRAVRRSIRGLRAAGPKASGDDSPLQDIWDEICAQVQGEHSMFWALYEDLMWESVAAECAKFTPIEARAVWLQTDAGFDWAYDDPADPLAIPICDDDLHYYVGDLLYSAAADETNARVELANRREHD